MINRQALHDAKAWAAGDDNIDVSWGYKMRGGQLTNEECVVFNVHKKRPLAALLTSETIPQTVDGVPTDVQEGVYVALATERHRPSLGGDSFGHEDITAGTLGGPVYVDGRRMALTNAHVAYPHWEGAAIGDRVTQPGPHDIREAGGMVSNEIYTWGKTHLGVTINFRNPLGGKLPGKNQTVARLWWKMIRGLGNGVANHVDCPYRVNVAPFDIPQPTPNRVDAAVVSPQFDDNMGGGIRTLGPIAGVMDPVLGLPLIKHGRTTDITRGTVTAIEGTASVNYGAGRIADFDHQGIARADSGDFSAGGDSGSMIFTEVGGELFWVGLLFAGGGGQTIFNYASEVIRLTGVQIL